MPKLNRVLGLPMLTFYGTGMILGAGIYTIIGKAAGIAGENVWLSLVLAAIAATLAALSYAELATMYPRVGGEYVYLQEAFPKYTWIANSGGLMMVLAGIATSSAVALAFAGYLQQFFPISTQLIAISLLSVFTVINILGIKESSWMNVLFTSIEVLGLLIFIYFGFQSPKFGEALLSSPSLATISGSALMIFAYFGFENMVNFVEETKMPEKTLPRAILLSIGISTIIYIFVALSAVSLLSPNELARSAAPLADAVRPHSVKFASVLASIALFATANTVLISLVTTSRIIYGMARERALPKTFSILMEKRKTPYIAALFTFAAACVLLPLSKVEVLASISSFATMLAFLAVHTALIVLRFQAPNQQRAFRTPLSIGKLPILPVLGIIVCTLLLLQFKATVYTVGGSILFAVIVVQWLLSRK